MVVHTKDALHQAAAWSCAVVLEAHVVATVVWTTSRAMANKNQSRLALSLDVTANVTLASN